MYTLRKAALLLSVIAVMVSTAGIGHADYQFDDVLAGSGKGSQWVIINDGQDTFGASYSEAIQISSDILTPGTARLNVINGTPGSASVSDRNMQTFFFVLSEGEGYFDVNVKSQPLDADVSTPMAGVDTIVQENLTPYVNTIDPDQSNNTTSEWKNYHFHLARQSSRNKYDTVIQSFYVQQNPSGLPSQKITRPMVVSNVYQGTAADGVAPLIVRMSLRDSLLANGNIIAYDRTAWTMNQSKIVGNNQWVFIPVDDLNTDNARIDYHLTTEIANNTAYRYAARFYDSTGKTEPPSRWKFDIFRPQGTTNIPREFILNSESNIAPGLVTVYNRRYNVNEQNKTPLHLFPMDAGTGDYGLTLNHKILFGKRLGETYTHPASEGSFNLFEVTAFNFLPASTSFLDTVASVTKSAGTVAMPTTSIFSSSSVTRTPIASDVLEYFTVNQNIPSSVRGSGSEGLLPLHITFNIPVTRNADSVWWDDMLQVWRNTGRIEDVFAQNYDLFLRADENNVWNLTEELTKKGYYSELVKVFFDDERGRDTQDNSRGLITVSFIVMLIDGTRDGVRPELSIVPDNSVAQQNNYIVVRDGTSDDRWNMTFFVAPKGWQSNPTNTKTDTNNNNTGSQGVNGGGSGGGGGCAAFGLAGIFALSLFAFIRAGRD